MLNKLKLWIMETTSRVEFVLGNEVDNSNAVYLYLEGNEWCAYERSAYYLSFLKAPVRLKKEIIRDGYDVVLMKACFTLDEISLPLAPKTVLKQVADDKLLFLVDSNIDGFFEWKQSQLNKLPA